MLINFKHNGPFFVYIYIGDIVKGYIVANSSGFSLNIFYENVEATTHKTFPSAKKEAKKILERIIVEAIRQRDAWAIR